MAPAEKTRCGHSFHAPCLKEWLRHSTDCPLCRGSLLAPPADGAGAAAPRKPHTGTTTITGEDIEKALLAAREAIEQTEWFKSVRSAVEEVSAT